MVSDIPGTTRDAIDTTFTDADGTRYNIIDTAGMRKKKAVEDETLERYSVLRSIAAIDRCDVALLLIDAQTGVTEQDTKIAGLILSAGKAVLVAVNKWDAVEKDTNTAASPRACSTRLWPTRRPASSHRSPAAAASRSTMPRSRARARRRLCFSSTARS